MSTAGSGAPAGGGKGERTPPPLPRTASPKQTGGFDPRIRAAKGVRGPRVFVIAMLLVGGIVVGIIYASLALSHHASAPSAATSARRSTAAPAPLADRYVAPSGNSITVGGARQPAPGATPNAAFSLAQGTAATPTLAPGFSVKALTSGPTSGTIGPITPGDIVKAEAGSDRAAIGALTSGPAGASPAPALASSSSSSSLPTAYVQVVGAPSPPPIENLGATTAQPLTAPNTATAPATQQTAAGTSIKDESSETNPHQVTRPLSPYVVQAGTFIQARLLNGVTSFSGGALVGMVASNVYDSVTQHTLLIPAGSKLLGTFASGAVAGQNRIAVIWTRLIFPNGDSVVLNGFAGTSSSGAPALNANVDAHTGALIVPTLLLSLLEAGATLSQGGTPQAAYGTSGSQSPAQAVGQSLAQQLDKLGTNITSAALAIAPTLSIAPAEPFNIEVASDMVFSHPYVPQGATP